MILPLHAYDSVVVFNELMYHPESGSTNEWIELYNQMSVDIDLSKWSIEGVDYTFPVGTILGGGKYLVIASNPDELKSRFGITNVVGPLSKNLANGGERIRLRNLNQRIMDEVEYADDDPWPSAPDGSGFSLAKLNRNTGSAEGKNWRASAQAGGTPGSENFAAEPASPPVSINEISASGAPKFWLELFNSSSNSVSLVGYQIRVVGGVNWTFTFTNQDAALDGGGYLVLDELQLLFRPAKGDRVLLVDADGQLVDGIKTKKTDRARNWARNGEWFVPSTTTPGALNQFQLEDSIVINEIMYHPRPTEAQPASYAETELVPFDGTWRFRQDGQSLPVDWVNPGFDDSSWDSGTGLFFNENSALPGPKNTPLQLGKTTYYFRTEFDFTGATNGVQLALHQIIDDGVIIYLNGREIYRYNMPEGAVDAGTFAINGVPDATEIGPITLPPDALQPGKNVLCAEVHQVNSTSSDIVFGCELMARVQVAPARDFAESSNQWVELFNRGTNSVNLTGWSIAGAPAYSFPPGSTIGAGEYIVLAVNPLELTNQFPELNPLPLTGTLSRGSGAVKLKDAFGNTVDEVDYNDAAPWPETADGKGASLELSNPFTDNTSAASWEASSNPGEWHGYTYSEVAQSDGGPVQWNEFVFGLLDAGEVLLDDFSVIEDPAGARKELLQDGGFENGGTSWRFLGTHRNCQVIDDPERLGNKILRLVADGGTEHMHNHVETTFLNNVPITNGKTYQISFRAKYINGCPKLNTRLYFNRLARTTLLQVPDQYGTPGRQNSTYRTTLGSVLSGLTHRPAVPKPSEPVIVSVQVMEPQQIESCTLWSGVNGTNWTSTMMAGSNDLYSGTIPAKPLGTVVQFYIEARNRFGATTWLPSDGPRSRALYRVNDNQRLSTRTHNFRLVLIPTEAASLHATTNVMSNGQTFGTLIYDESEVFYNCSLHLQSSERGRSDSTRVGYTVSFPSDHLFRGVQDSITFDRSGGWSGHGGRQDEIVMRHIINQAGYLPDMYNDLANLIAPDPTYSGAAMLAMSKYGNHYIDGTSLAKDGSLFKLELVYFPTTTVGGDPQKPKLPQPDDVIGQDLHNMGDDPETYRWYLLTESKPWRSDYRQIIDVAKMFSLSGIAQETEAKRILDMDEWTRVFAAKSLSGDADTYGFGYPHNQLIYVSEGSKAVTFPWDLDFSWSRSPTDSIDAGSSIGALINSSPAFRRLYLGHLDDILKQSYNTTYMSRWTTHYGALVQQNYSGILTYIGQRAASVRSQFPFLAPFQITNNKGQNFTTNITSLVLSGTAPFTLKELRIGGVSSSDIKWQTISNWSAAINLTNGVNSIQVIGSDFQNQVVATNTILINALLPLQDSDGDLIPDDWESAHGLDPFTADANGDLDGDGFSNYAEYMAGTDPANPVDALHLEARSISPSQLNLQFTAKPSHSYRLQYRPGLTALWQDLVVVPSSPNERIISQAQTINPLAPSLFFRVLLGPEFP